MNPIKFECPHCHEIITGDESLYGQEVKCRKCQSAIRVPQPPASTEPQTARLIQESPPAAPIATDEAAQENDIFNLSPVARAFPGRILLGLAFIALAIGLAIRAQDFSWPRWVPLVPLALGVLLLLLLWIKVKSCSYRLTTQRLFVRRGWLAKHVNELELYRVKDVVVEQAGLQRLPGYGTVTVLAADDTTPEVDLVGVSRPTTVKETIRTQDRHARPKTRRVWAVVCLAVKKFMRIDGTQWAGAFAFSAFFALFPLMVLLVTIASFFVDRNRAGQEVIACVESYIPISGEMQRHIFDTIAGVIKAREQAGAVALVILVWTAIQCFTTLICATNRAWGTTVYNWWRLPLKSLVLLGITAGSVLLGMAVPVLTRMTEGWLFPVHGFGSWAYYLGRFFIPLLVVFFSLGLFYRLAPRRPTRFAEVWVATLCATLLLRAGESLFVIYLEEFATLNAVYGAFGGIMALLLWIYFSGCVFTFGACLCAAQAEVLGHPSNCHPRSASKASCSTKGGLQQDSTCSEDFRGRCPEN